MKRAVSIMAVSMLLLAACGKKDGNTNVTGGGKGGNGIIKVAPEHHSIFVDSCTIYIKYGTTDAPSDGIYDDSAKCILFDTVPIATFSNLKVGLYYLFASGYHAGYTPPFVKGGISCTMQKEETLPLIYLPTY